MNDTTVIHLALQAVVLAFKLAGPILAVSVAIGFAVSVLQSATQIQEQTLAFVPKLIGVAAVLLLTGSWMMHEFESFTTGLFASLPNLLS